jgi:hypothetical protein
VSDGHQPECFFGVWSCALGSVKYPETVEETERVIDFLHANLAGMFHHRLKLHTRGGLGEAPHYMPNSDNLYSLPSTWIDLRIGGQGIGL